MSYYVYIHIPFCLNKCSYCSFVSFAGMGDCGRKYFDVLYTEIETFFKNNPHQKLKTLYIGGGTPSVLPVEYYKNCLELFEFEDEYEFTFEINPKTVDDVYLKSLKELGVNRLSIGIQSFDDNLLKIINRQHSSADAISCFESARRCGFENISIDLIYGLPAQTIEILNKSLETAILLNPEHISIYGLKIEEGCEFFKKRPKDLPSDDECADMYLEIVDKLGQNGFEQYEISNFAKPQKFSRHNMNYWKNREYIGFGLASHGYFLQNRYSHEVSLDDYIKNPFPVNKKFVDFKERQEDEVILNLRTKDGVDLDNFKEQYQVDFLKEYKSVLDKYAEFFKISSNKVSLTAEGFLVSNFILSEFLGN